MRLLKVSVILLVAALSGCNARQGPVLTPKSEADKLALNRLNERIRKVDFDNADLKDVIQSFRKVTGANIYVHWKALEAAGPKRNTPVKMHLRDVPFREALTKCLGSIKSSAPITYALADGVVLISTPEDASELARRINDGPTRGKTEADKRASKWRKERISEVNLDDIELRDILDFLNDRSGTGIYIPWKKPEPAGVDGRALVKVHLRNVTLHTALTLCLADAGGGKPVSYIIKYGEIRISTREGLKKLREAAAQPATAKGAGE